MVQGVVIDEENRIVDKNPSTGKVIARVPCSTAEEVRATVERARLAQAEWNSISLDQRIELLKRAVATIGERRVDLIDTIVKEMGKIRSEAEAEVDGAIDKAGFLDLVVEANRPVATENAVIVRDPHGVVGVCSPWNFPADEALLLALPALASGNTVVVKPSEVAPLTGAIVIEALQKSLPLGTVGLLQGDGTIGAALVESEVNMMAMTGSSATGRKIMAACASDLKRLVLELGGKDPMVVFADADLALAAKDAVEHSLENCGQVCCSVERIYIEASAKDDFEKLCAQEAVAYVAGDGFDTDAKIGPMVSEMQRDFVKSKVDDAVQRGAKVVATGPIKDNVSSSGFFYPATVLSDVGHDFPITCSETFGPVVAISSFDGSEEAAIKLANDTEYGLAAYVYTSDMERAVRIATKIKAGQVGINNYALATAPARAPWIGAKGSGFGHHSGIDGWRQFSVPKSLVFSSAEMVPKWLNGVQVSRTDAASPPAPSETAIP